jgi:hypothetical protein
MSASDPLLGRAAILGEPAPPRLLENGGHLFLQLFTYAMATGVVQGMILPYTDHLLLALVLAGAACGLLTAVQHLLVAAWQHWQHDWFRAMVWILEFGASLGLYVAVQLLTTQFSTTFLGAGPASQWAYFACLTTIGILLAFWLTRRSVAVLLNGDLILAKDPKKL